MNLTRLYKLPIVKNNENFLVRSITLVEIFYLFILHIFECFQFSFGPIMKSNR